MNKTLSLALGLLLLAQTSVAATVTNINDLVIAHTGTTEVSDAVILNGIFELTYLGSDAGHTNKLLDGTTEIFAGGSTAFGTTYTGNIANLFLKDSSDNAPNNLGITQNTNGFLQIHIATEDITFGSLLITQGSYIFGFNDDGYTVDKDHNDLVFTARAVPVPAAVWMLGSGLIGLLGLRKKLTV